MPVSAERTAEGPTNSMKPQPIRRRTRIKIIEFLMRHPLALVDTNRKRTGAWRPNKGSASLRFWASKSLWIFLRSTLKMIFKPVSIPASNVSSPANSARQRVSSKRILSR